MSSWEDIADEVAPLDAPFRGLATGARRGPARAYARGEATGEATGEPELRRVAAPFMAGDGAFEAMFGEGGREVTGSRGAHFEVSLPAARYDGAFDNLPERLARALQGDRFLALSGAQPKDLLFCDIETTGLSSDGPLFLIGALHFPAGDQAQLDLLLARHPDEERAALHTFAQKARHKSLVTFNGKSFDWPYIRGRARRLGVPMPEPAAHLDLLHLARRTWKGRVPNCRLQTLEQCLCNRGREGDVPSSRIPSEYERFVEIYQSSGRGAPIMAPMLHHNALDVLTMAELLCLAGEKK